MNGKGIKELEDLGISVIGIVEGKWAKPHKGYVVKQGDVSYFSFEYWKVRGIHQNMVMWSYPTGTGGGGGLNSKGSTKYFGVQGMIEV